MEIALLRSFALHFITNLKLLCISCLLIALCLSEFSKSFFLGFGIKEYCWEIEQVLL